MGDPIPALKEQLGREIARRLERWGTTDVACFIGTDPGRISELRRGKLQRFSLETLIRYLTRLRCTVTVEVAERRRAAVRVNGGRESRASSLGERRGSGPGAAQRRTGW